MRYVFQQNQRQAAARNRGIAAARGTLIALLDHDDLWEPEKLARQVPLFDDERVGLVYCGAHEVDAKGKHLWKKGIEKFRRGAIFDALLFDHFITNSSVVIRRACLDQVGLFREDLFGVDDTHLWLRICYDWHADFVPDILVACRSHESNMKKDPDIIPEKAFIMMRDIFQRFGLDQTLRDHWLALNADHQFFLGYRLRSTDRVVALKHFLKAMSYRPRWIQLLAIVKLLIPGYYGMAARLRRPLESRSP